MKSTLIILILFISCKINAQTIDSQNFFSIIKGTWIVEYYSVDWKPLRDLKYQPNPDTVIIHQNGIVQTHGTYSGYKSANEELWTSFDDKTKRIYYKYLQMDKTYSKVLERYKVLFISKNEMKVEYIGYSEIDPQKPVKTRIIFKRIK